MLPTATVLLLGFIASNAASAAGIDRWELNITNPEMPKHRISMHMLLPSEAMEKDVPGPYPLVVFMHGDPCEWWWYEYVGNYLVPSGYVVALMSSYEPAGAPPKMSLDMRYTLDYLYNQSANVTGSRIFGKLSYKAAAAGHSAGSDAALMVMGKASQEFRHQFDAVYAMASVMADYVREAVEHPISRPKVFMLAGSSDCMCPPSVSIPIYNAIADNICKFYGILTHGTHCHFADIVTIDHVCYEVEVSSCPAKWKHGRPIVPRNIQLTMSKSFMLHFLDAVLKEADGSVEQHTRLDALHGLMMNEQASGYMTNVSMSCSI